MSDTARAVLLGVFTLASCVWVGGYVAIGVTARVARRTLDPAQRVAFFRGLGRSYLLVGAPALVIALGTGAGLARSHASGGMLAATVAVAATLVAALSVGVAQARRMTKLRAAALTTPHDDALTRRMRSGARVATALRAAIGVLSLALIALGSLLAS